MKSQACPLLKRASSAGPGLRFPLALLLPCACPLSSVFFRLHLTVVARIPSSPKTPPARCRVGCAPLSLASSFFVSMRRASCLPSSRPLNGSSLLTNPCYTLPEGTWCHSWPSTSAASPSPPAGSSEECCSRTDWSSSTSPEQHPTDARL
jgi:hypothetical protein